MKGDCNKPETNENAAGEGDKAGQRQDAEAHVWLALVSGRRTVISDQKAQRDVKDQSRRELKNQAERKEVQRP